MAAPRSSEDLDSLTTPSRRRLMSTPRSLDLAITNRCNLRCLYCYHFGGSDDVGLDLPTAEWLRFFEELKACAVTDVCLCGGEPFIREDLKELVDGLVRNRMRFSILSNGTLITDEMAAFLKSTRRCDSVQISIDGASPGTHDAARGQGTFRLAVQGLKTLQKNGLSAAVRVTIHKYNVHHLDEIARLLLEELGLPAFSTNSAGLLGLCRVNATDIQLNVEERSLAMATLLKLERKYPGRITANAGPLAEARMWLEMEQARRSRQPARPTGGCLLSCGGVFTKMAVRADGVMVPCSQMPHIELGRINRDSLREIWQKHPDLQRLRERRDIPLAEFEFCAGCAYLPYCKGSCPALAHSLTGLENHPNPGDCLKRFLEQGGRLPDETRLESP
jgi:SynChlorMet cassette radical SAM/SPASM protein ScmE